MKIICLTICILFPSYSWAETAKTYTIQDMENYLSNMITFKANFRQIIPGFDIASGTFYLKRPRKFLWQYETPEKYKLISTGSHLYFHDKSNEQVTQLPLNSGLAAILLRPQMRFNDGFTLVRFNQNKVKVEVVLAPSEDTAEEMGSNSTLNLSFLKNPLRLWSIVTTDNLGREIFITFSSISQDIELDNGLFKFIPPHYDNMM